MEQETHFMNSTEAAEYLHLSDRTIRTLCKERKIRHVRMHGNRLRFQKEWLDEYLKSITFEPIKEENENE